MPMQRTPKREIQVQAYSAADYRITISGRCRALPMNQREIVLLRALLAEIEDRASDAPGPQPDATIN